MNQSRRDLLKFFAAGTIIAPVAGGATAKLIEVPKAELIVAPEPQIVRPFRSQDIESLKVEITLRDGSKREVSGGSTSPGWDRRDFDRYWSGNNWRVDLAIENTGSPLSYWSVACMTNAEMK